jgi:hypothetical protein
MDYHQATIKATTASFVVLEIAGERRVIRWDALELAAAQPDRKLAATYTAILAKAKWHWVSTQEMIRERLAAQERRDEYLSKPNDSNHGSNVDPTAGTH